jgi:hypothetical protein
MAGPYEHSNEPSGSIKGEEFLDKLSDCQLLKDSAPMEFALFQFLFLFLNLLLEPR